VHFFLAKGGQTQKVTRKEGGVQMAGGVYLEKERLENNWPLKFFLLERQRRGGDNGLILRELEEITK